MNEQKKVEFFLNPDEIQAISELSEQFPNGSLGIKKKTLDLTETIQSVDLVVRVYGYCGDTTWVWRNNEHGWVEYSYDIYDIW